MGRAASHPRCTALRRIVLAGLLVAASFVPAQAQIGGDAAAKAKLVVAFARFVQWPDGSFETPAAPLRLCLLQGSPDVERAFRLLLGADVNGHALQLEISPKASGKACHLLFVDDSAGLEGQRVLARLGGDPIFTVGAQDGFASAGGMVEIVHVDDALRFDVNLAALRMAGLRLNPGVLKLARQVRQ